MTIYGKSGAEQRPFWQNIELNLGEGVRLMYISSVAMYGAEIWTMDM